MLRMVVSFDTWDEQRVLFEYADDILDDPNVFELSFALRMRLDRQIILSSTVSLQKL